MGKIIVTIDPAVLNNVKKTIHGNSTSDGIEMLGLNRGEAPHTYNYFIGRNLPLTKF